jgi:proline racemase
MITRIQTIDAHTAGEPLRLIVDGFPRPQGATMLEKREWLRKHHDRLRRALMLEPRGHVDMYGALLTEPVHAGSDAGVLFMHNEGYSTMCGHGVIAVVTIALERGLISLPGGRPSIVLDAPAGPVRARWEWTDQAGDGGARSVASVAFVNVPSFVLASAVPVRLGRRELRVDVAFGGAFYAIVDAETAGLPIDGAHLDELRRAGTAITREVESAVRVEHPLESGLKGLYGTIFTGPPTSGEADLRNVTILPKRKSIGLRAARARARSWRCSTRWACSPSITPSSTRASSAPASGAGWWDRRPSGICRRSCPRSRGRRTSPGNTRS